MLSNYICSLDIGSSKISAVVAQLRRNRLVNIYCDNMPSKGVKNGVVVDSIDLIGVVSALLKRLRSKSGINIKYIYTNISGKDITTKHSHAVIPLAERGNKVITLSDIYKVNEQARILGSNLEEEIIHQIPSGYSIDSASSITNPLGLYSHRLETDLYLVCAELSSVQSLTRAINQAGFEIRRLLLSCVATSKVVFGDELKSGQNILCDIGSDATEIAVFRNGALSSIEILNVGGDSLTRQLEEELKLPYNLAEDVKRSYGAAGDYANIGEDKEILVKRDDVYRPIKRKLVAEIIGSKTKSVCQKIKDSVTRITDVNMVDNFVATGRGMLQDGFLETLENTLGIPVKLGRISEPELASLVNKHDELSGQKHLTYLACLGMIAYARNTRDTLAIPSNVPAGNIFSKAVNRFKEVYQEYF